MAKARDIAALAGLAGLAYAMRNKSKPNEDAGDQKTSSYTGDTKKVEAKVEAKDEPLRKIEDYQKKAPGDEKGSAQSDVLKTVTAPKAVSNAQAGNQGVLGGSTPSPKPKLKPRGMTGSQNTALAKANQSSADSRNVNYGNEGNRVVGEKSTPAMLPGSDPFEIFRGGKLHPRTGRPMKSGGAVQKMAKGGMTSKVSSASSRADGIASRGKTKCKMY
jgi:hypothetical protein